MHEGERNQRECVCKAPEGDQITMDGLTAVGEVVRDYLQAIHKPVKGRQHIKVMDLWAACIYARI